MSLPIDKPHDVPLHMSVLGTAKGVWVMRVHSVSSIGQTIQIRLVLKRRSRCSRLRILDAVLFAPDLGVALERAMIADRIRKWIETTEADGVLDLVSNRVA